MSEEIIKTVGVYRTNSSKKEAIVQEPLENGVWSGFIVSVSDARERAAAKWTADGKQAEGEIGFCNITEFVRPLERKGDVLTICPRSHGIKHTCT